MPTLSGKTRLPKLMENCIWWRLGLHLGGVWDGLGPFVCALGDSLVALGTLLGVLVAKMSSKKPFGWILGRFGKVGGRFREALWGNFQGFGAECWERLGRARENWDSWAKSWGKLRQAKKKRGCSHVCP